MLYRSLFLSFFLFNIIAYSNAQGCSDAGACSIGDIKSPGKHRDSVRMNALTVGITYGAGYEKTKIITPYLQYERNLGSRLSVLARLTAAFANGDLGDNSGAGDLYVAGNYLLSSGASSKVTLIGGVKIPLNNADAKNDEGIPLPMEYQSSLGTVDVIIGLGAGLGRNFEVSIAAQIPVVNNNENTFFPFLFENGNANAFIPTNKFVRQADMLFKAAYNFNINEKFSLKPSILAIYHTAEDKFTNLSGEQVAIEGSDGLTVNIGIAATYYANEDSQFEFVIGAPAAVREKRPDGLTRAFVAGLQYRMAF